MARIGEYEVGEELGRGGMGVVLRGRARDGRAVAIKLVHSASPTARERFAREARLQGDLGEGEGFVPLLAQGICPQGPYLVMPLLTGGTLRQRLRAGPMAIEDGVALGVALARSVGRAHARGVIHRDLKPENVLFTGDGRALLADLGLAKHFSSDSGGPAATAELSRTGETRGTLGYMAPEQVRDAKNAGPAADVFALGAILYEALSGVPPFGGDTGLEVMAAVLQGTYDPLPSRRPDVPVAVARVVDRALAPEPEDRFPDGEALAAAIEDAAAGRGPSSRVPLVLAAVPGLAVVALGVALVASRPGGEGTAPSTSPAPAPIATTSPPPSQPPPIAPVVPGLPADLQKVAGTRARIMQALGAPGPAVTTLVVDGDRVVSASVDATGARTWSLAGGGETARLPAETGLNAVAVGGRWVVAAGRDRALHAWDAQGVARRLIIVEAGDLLCVAVTPDGRRALVGCSEPPALIELDLADGVEVRRLAAGTQSAVVGVSSSQDGGHYLTLDVKGRGRVWAALDSDSDGNFAGEGPAVGLAGEWPRFLFLIAGQSTGREPVADVWDVSGYHSGSTVRTQQLRGHEAALTAGVVVPNTTQAVTAAADGSVLVWDLTRGQVTDRLALPAAHHARSLAARSERHLVWGRPRASCSRSTWERGFVDVACTSL